MSDATFDSRIWRMVSGTAPEPDLLRAIASRIGNALHLRPVPVDNDLGDEFSSAAHTGLVEDRLQMLLHRQRRN